MKLSDFDYAYPDELIARHPAEPRDSARLMVLDRQRGTIEHRVFRDLPEYFNAGDALIVNDTKVYPARLFAHKDRDGARVEVFLLRELSREHRLWDALVAPARRVRVGNMLHFDDDLVAEVVDNTTSRGRTVRFLFEGTDEAYYQRLDALGSTPLPPYLKRPATDEDRDTYQTIFAEHRGAVAAPTAGLHFTPNVVSNLQTRGVNLAPITLHVGLGTFRPVEAEDPSRHHMDSECFVIPEASAETINAALNTDGCTVTAVGTTAVRAVESSVAADLKHLKADSGWTDKFIYPPYDFRIVQRLVTNFHMPRSTLLMLVSAFAGREFILEAYETAIREEYRLFSYGDAMLIL